MSDEIVINATAGETRVGIVERDTFTELHIEREAERSVAGAVIKGRVTRVLPGMQAAFVEIGLDKAAFLYAGDYFDDSKPPGENGDSGRRGRGGRNGRNRQPPNIDTLLREGQEIVVQVAKEPIGTKGARITSNISIPGRHLVLTPLSPRVGVSRRIDSERERRRLREIVSRLRPPDLGFIIRTAGEGTTEADLEADVRYLSGVWDRIQEKRESAVSPMNLHNELSLPLRVIRDLLNKKTKRITVDDRQVYEEMRDFLSAFVADPKPKLDHYEGSLPIFDHFKIESAIDTNLGKRIWLKSGGYLIVDQSEALTAIDVNTGRFVGKRDLEETVLRTNLEAVKEVVYQLRFRNIGGIIIIDLIDMEPPENREKVYRALQDALRQDKARTNILKISELGLVEMTRKRTRENLVQQLCESCEYCEGRGYVLSSESMAYKVLREIRKDLPRFCGRQIAISVHPRVAEVLLGRAHRACRDLGEQLGCEIEIRGKPTIHQEQFEVTALDSGPPVSLPLEWLGDRPAKAEVEAEETAAVTELALVAVAATEPIAVPEPGVPESAGPETQASPEPTEPTETVETIEPAAEAADPNPPGDVSALSETAADGDELGEGGGIGSGNGTTSAPDAPSDPVELLDGEAEISILPPPEKLEES